MLNRFRGELTMLDSRGGGQDLGAANINENTMSAGDQSNISSDSDAVLADDLDDEIPF